ncbi:MAG: DUF424 family protein [Nanoarchaeota archaeon]|mgnify:CR=1 FL=1
MYVKIHKSYRNVVAICDEELLNKIFEEGERQLDVRENFFKDRKLQKEEIVRLIKMYSLEDSTFNIVGENSIEAAREAGLINKDDAGKIKGIPFILVF